TRGAAPAVPPEFLVRGSRLGCMGPTHVARRWSPHAVPARLAPSRARLRQLRATLSASSRGRNHNRGGLASSDEAVHARPRSVVAGVILAFVTIVVIAVALGGLGDRF